MAFKPRGIPDTDVIDPTRLRALLRQTKLQTSSDPADSALYQFLDSLSLVADETKKDLAILDQIVADLAEGESDMASSGTYIPTLVNVTNLTGSTAFTCGWFRVADMVFVSGTVDVNPTVAGIVTQLGMSIPVPSLLASAGELSGSGVSLNIGMESAAIIGDATNDRAQMDWVVGFIGNQKFYFSFSYQVL